MKYKYITSIGALIIIFSLGGLSTIQRDRKDSDLEGRTLAQNPLKKKGKIEKLKNGDFQKEWDSYFNDQIIGRDSMVSTYTKLQKGMSKKNINNVYLGEEGYLLSTGVVKDKDKEELEKGASYYEEMESKLNMKKMYLVNVPHKIMVHEKEMPIKGFEDKGNKYIDVLFSNLKKVKGIDLRKVLQDGEEKYYYKTDHHLNMDGVYKSYREIIESIRGDFKEVKEPLEKEEFSIKKYEKCFLGSDGRKVNSIENNLEDIEIYNHKTIDKFKTTIPKIYREDLISKDKLNNDYRVYLGGDNPKVEIENKEANNKLKIAVVGDSIDNPLIPLLGLHFSKVYSYDLRKYKEDIIGEINKNKVDIVLFIGLTNNYILGEEGKVFAQG